MVNKTHSFFAQIKREFQESNARDFQIRIDLHYLTVSVNESLSIHLRGTALQNRLEDSK